ncbi:MAG: hypothetical protein DI587_26340 [Variovorax paradoxus]|nr:MAG: hypothetical protein DI583_26340 [Variovorax paradoxus]PZQ04751.1 MAG: hypothetical protein DI587_26340 [Variovorax paradoxus]
MGDGQAAVPPIPPYTVQFLLLLGRVAMPVLVHVTGLVPWMSMVLIGLAAHGRRTLVTVPVLIQVAGHMALVVMVRSRLFGGLVAHENLLKLGPSS